MATIFVQMDELAHLNHETDTTLFLCREASRRGARLFHYEARSLYVADGRVLARAAGFSFDEKKGWHGGVKEEHDLMTADVILMRQDPPFDMAYVTASYFLSLLEGHKERGKNAPRIVNNPAGVRACPEKIAACYFAHLMPATLITMDGGAYQSFCVRHGRVVIKPLHDKGGAGIFITEADDPNFMVAFETLIAHYHAPVMVQEYCPAIETTGDKRLLLLDGEYIGGFTRLPSKGDGRANLVRGGKAQPCELSHQDEKIIKELAPFLRRHGLFFVGLDVIGETLTEINVTSPTGLVTLHQLTDIDGAKVFWDKLGIK